MCLFMSLYARKQNYGGHVPMKMIPHSPVPVCRDKKIFRINLDTNHEEQERNPYTP